MVATTWSQRIIEAIVSAMKMTGSVGQTLEEHALDQSVTPMANTTKIGTHKLKTDNSGPTIQTLNSCQRATAEILGLAKLKYAMIKK